MREGSATDTARGRSFVPPEKRLHSRHVSRVLRCFPYAHSSPIEISTQICAWPTQPKRLRRNSFPRQSKSYKHTSRGFVYFVRLNYGTLCATTQNRRSGAQRGAPRRTSARGFLGRPFAFASLAALPILPQKLNELCGYEARIGRTLPSDAFDSFLILILFPSDRLPHLRVDRVLSTFS